MHNQMNSSTKYMFLSVGHCGQAETRKCKLKEPKNLGSRSIHLSMKKKVSAITDMNRKPWRKEGAVFSCRAKS